MLVKINGNKYKVTEFYTTLYQAKKALEEAKLRNKAFSEIFSEHPIKYSVEKFKHGFVLKSNNGFSGTYYDGKIHTEKYHTLLV
jgi:hypothetical protein